MSRRVVIIFTCVAFLITCSTQVEVSQKRTFSGLFDWIRCDGCPPRFCDDDPAIIYGYCCGCAGLFDELPVHCAPGLFCPANNYELCRQYKYMLTCCCPIRK